MKKRLKDFVYSLLSNENVVFEFSTGLAVMILLLVMLAMFL